MAAKKETISTKVPIGVGPAKYLEDYPLTAFEQVISKAMSLQVIYGWEMKAAVREAMREVSGT